MNFLPLAAGTDNYRLFYIRFGFRDKFFQSTDQNLGFTYNWILDKVSSYKGYGSLFIYEFGFCVDNTK